MAFADDLLLATRGESVRAVENYANAELSKITLWSKNNKIIFNVEISKVMLVSRRKRRELRKMKQQTTGASYSDEILGHNYRPQI